MKKFLAIILACFMSVFGFCAVGCDGTVGGDLNKNPGIIEPQSPSQTTPNEGEETDGKPSGAESQTPSNPNGDQHESGSGYDHGDGDENEEGETPGTQPSQPEEEVTPQQPDPNPDESGETGPVTPDPSDPDDPDPDEPQGPDPVDPNEPETDSGQTSTDPEDPDPQTPGTDPDLPEPEDPDLPEIDPDHGQGEEGGGYGPTDHEKEPEVLPSEFQAAYDEFLNSFYYSWECVPAEPSKQEFAQNTLLLYYLISDVDLENLMGYIEFAPFDDIAVEYELAGEYIIIKIIRP